MEVEVEGGGGGGGGTDARRRPHDADYGSRPPEPDVVGLSDGPADTGNVKSAVAQSAGLRASTQYDVDPTYDHTWRAGAEARHESDGSLVVKPVRVPTRVPMPAGWVVSFTSVSETLCPCQIPEYR